MSITAMKQIRECLAVLRPAVKGKYPHEQALEELAGYAIQEAEACDPCGTVKQKRGYPEGHCFVLWTKDIKPGDSLYLTPQAAQPTKPLFRDFIAWAAEHGYDIANTCNSDTGEWICLNPMTADLWKAWQAAQGIKERNT